jgi:NADPH:quinone reductase-like Zn-dependent oxidoreductase
MGRQPPPSSLRVRRCTKALVIRSSDSIGALQDREAIQRCRSRTFELFDQGRLRALVDEVSFSGLESIVDATDHMLSGRAIGKVVVELQNAGAGELPS